MVYLILLIILVAITYGCLLIFAQVDNWINSNIKNVLLCNVIRALVAVVLIPIPLLFVAASYIIGYSYFNKDK